MYKNRYVNNNGYIIYLWSVIFLMTVNVFSFFLETDGFIIYVIYTFFAIPYYRHLEKFAVICYIFSTIAFFFTGADESIWSIYTIYIGLVLVSMLCKRKYVLKKLLPLIFMIIPVCLSYMNSEIHYEKGLFLLLFNILVAAIFAASLDFDKDNDTLVSFFPFIASIQIVIYFLAVLGSGTMTIYGSTIVTGLNHNAFGISCAQLGTILGVKVLIFDKFKKKAYLFLLILSFFVTFLSGSRNAFLGLLIALFFIYVYKQKKEKRYISGLLKLGLIVSFILIFANLVLPIYGFDLSRYNYADVVSSGGSNRLYLWSQLIPVIIERYNIWGYGPSHYCSEVVVSPLVGRRYVHTHNLIIEVWGELGLVGLIPFIFLIRIIFITIHKKVKLSEKYLVFYALLIEMMVNGIGESMFADIVMWLLFAFIFSTTRFKWGRNTK